MRRRFPSSTPGARVRGARFRVAEFTASGSGTFDVPRYDVRFRVNDLFIGEENIGQVTGTLARRGNELSGQVDASSPRLSVTGTGRIAMTPQADADITLRFHDSALDPYVRLFAPKFAVHHGRCQRNDAHRRRAGRCRSSAGRRHGRCAGMRFDWVKRRAGAPDTRSAAGEHPESELSATTPACGYRHGGPA